MPLQVEDFQEEIDRATRNYEKFVICIDKIPEDFLRSLQSLLKKAIPPMKIAGLASGTD